MYIYIYISLSLYIYIYIIIIPGGQRPEAAPGRLRERRPSESINARHLQIAILLKRHKYLFQTS